MKLACIVLALCCLGLAQAVLNVHVNCHTHDDVGWLKTVDQYYMGANNSIQHAGVQYILDSVTLALQANPARKFSYVEQAFFQRWWREQSPETQNVWRGFVNNGQVEFINGGWCMHDEAAAHYVAMVDQTTLGHRFLLQEFGVTPKIGWQIDPFGHSATQAALLSAEVGFDALYFGRIDYQDHDLRMAQRRMEFIWRASQSLPEAQLFTGAFQDGNYGPPEDFCFDLFCDDLPIQDDNRLDDFNVQNRVDLFVKRVMDMASHVQGNDLMINMGSDFQYENANLWYKNLDKLMKYVNKDGRVKVFYSTPSQYTYAKTHSGLQWEVKTDDFFPYADWSEAYWTGYFTSRPALKRYVYQGSAYLQAARQFELLFGQAGTDTLLLEQSVSIAQHHDGVSGTSKQHVAFDYAKRISNGWDDAESMINRVLSGDSRNKVVQQCRLLNESLCQFTQSRNSFWVGVWNQLMAKQLPQPQRIEYIAVPVSNPNLGVYDGSTRRASQIVDAPLSASPGAPKYSLIFPVDLQPLATTSYLIKPTSEGATFAKSRPAGPLDDIIENDIIKLTFSGGYLKSMTNKISNITTALTQQFLYYRSAVDPEGKHQNSGAYIFRPNKSDTDALPVSTQAPNISFTRGQIVQEARQSITPWLTQTIRLYQGQAQAEFEWRVGPVPIDDGQGKEVITRFNSDIKSSGAVWTDSNGREMQKRQKDYRPTWTWNNTEPIAGNFYPVNAMMFINDATRQLTILNDRSQGGASLVNGSMELMIHRRTLNDDSRGVGEPLNETDSILPYPTPIRLGKGLIIVGKHYLVFEKPALSARIYRPLASRVFSTPVVTFWDPSDAAVVLKSAPMGKMAADPLPSNVELMTCQVMTGQPPGTALVRLSHMYAVGEDADFSKAVNVSLQSIFPLRTLSKVQELSLTANQPKSTMAPYPAYRIKGEPEPTGPTRRSVSPPIGDDFTVTLNPMEIRTYSLILSD